MLPVHTSNASDLLQPPLAARRQLAASLQATITLPNTPCLDLTPSMLAKLKNKMSTPTKAHKRRPTISAPIPIPTCLQPQPVTQEDAWATLAAAYEAKAARSPASSISSAPSSCYSRSRDSRSSASSVEVSTPCRAQRHAAQAEAEDVSTPVQIAMPQRFRSSASSATSWDVLHELIDDSYELQADDAASVFSHTSIVTDYEEGQYTIKRAEVVAL